MATATILLPSIMMIMGHSISTGFSYCYKVVVGALVGGANTNTDRNNRKKEEENEVKDE